MEKNKLSKLILIQTKWRSLLLFKNDLENELFFFRKLVNTLINKLEINKKSSLISSINYKKSIDLIDQAITTLISFPKKISIKFLSTITKFKIFSSLSKIKLTIIELSNLIGCLFVKDCITLFLGKNELDKVSDEYMSHIDYYNDFFTVLKSETYISTTENNISFKLNTYGKEYNKTSTVTLASYQINIPSVNKYNIFMKTFKIKVSGAKIYIPLSNKLIVLYGFFNNDQLSNYKGLKIFKTKFNKTKLLFENLDIKDQFKNNFIENLSNRDFLINISSDIAKSCMSSFTDLNKFKHKNISLMVKEFILSDLLKQRYIIINLLLDSEYESSSYLAHLFLDLLRSDNQNVINKTADDIYESLPWNIKKQFKNNEEIINQINKKISNYNEESIPYEKRIYLMKTEDYVKSKAMDKLKEINSSKNSEGNAKAQQYLDGLLKIPFGNYIKESIIIKLDELVIKYNTINSLIIKDIQLLEENNTLSDNDLESTSVLQTIVDNCQTSIYNPLNLSKFNKKLKNWIIKLVSTLFSLDDFVNVNKALIELKKLKVVDLKDLVQDLNITIVGKIKKDTLIDGIIKYKYNQSDFEKLKTVINIEPNYVSIFESNEFTNIVTNIEQINSLWISYTVSQSNYFKNITNTLDGAVYGLDVAKNQIKRLLAQWINGKNQGYVFGFEGPPGTGKTTLAKKGIAQCLKDEQGHDRPFVFIALGGSSNGSTLEGHNYTYVGSTWGRIIDGIMDSKCMNPIIYIDELDKISKTEQGKEIIGILTHLTDPSQNTEFTDKYFSGIKFDISKCLIIFSYNDPNLIDRILLDRIQRVKVDHLSKIDKVMVAKHYILPEILENIGYSDIDICIEDDELIYIIDIYTYEAGARKLKEKLYEIYRQINIKYLIDGADILPFKITQEYIDEVFTDYPKHEIVKIHDQPKTGLVNGLFATSAGIGGITIIEAFKFLTTTHLELKLTGMQGDVMKESMNVAKTLALNLIPVDILTKVKDEKNKFGIHIHCPAGATPKDGPSAGTAITLAIVSLLCDIPILNTMALTGEIDLNGNVLPIGGLDSKVEGGKVAGVLKILCPKKNETSLKKIRNGKNPPEDDNFKIEMIEHIYQAMDQFLLIPNGKSAREFFNEV